MLCNNTRAIKSLVRIIGTRVTRGRDWKHNIKHDNGPGRFGTVTRISKSTKKNVYVKWDNDETKEKYCMGGRGSCKNTYHLTISECTNKF